MSYDNRFSMRRNLLNTAFANGVAGVFDTEKFTVVSSDEDYFNLLVNYITKIHGEYPQTQDLADCLNPKNEMKFDDKFKYVYLFHECPIRIVSYNNMSDSGVSVTKIKDGFTTLLLTKGDYKGISIADDIIRTLCVKNGLTMTPTGSMPIRFRGVDVSIAKENSLCRDDYKFCGSGDLCKNFIWRSEEDMRHATGDIERAFDNISADPDGDIFVDDNEKLIALRDDPDSAYNDLEA